MHMLLKGFAALLLGLLLTGTGLQGPAVALAAAQKGEQARIFVYHRFGDERYPSTNIALETFKAQLQWLKEQEVPVVSLGRVVAARRGEETLPAGAVALAVDDGFTSFLRGWELLQKYGFPVTLFVNTDSVGTGDYLDWSQLQKLAQEGVAIGNHSASHAYFLDRYQSYDEAAWQQWVKQDLKRAQQAFAQHLGQQPQLFAYPYGEYNLDFCQVVRNLGFTAAFGQHSGVVGAGSRLFALPRFPMGGPYATLQAFRNKARMQRLPVDIIAPQDTLWTASQPPRLRFRLPTDQGLKLKQLRCYIAGQEPQRPQPLDEKGTFAVQSPQPLQGRRTKYTLTAPGSKGWYWFSHVWIQPQRPGSGRE